MRRWMRGIGLMAAVVALLALAAPAGALTIERSYQRFGCVAGEALTTGAVLTMKASDGLCYKADADDATLRPAIGIAASGASSGGSVGVITAGIVGGGSSLTKGGAVYLSTTAGATTQTQPAAYSQLVGRAVSATQYVIGVRPYRAVQTVVIPVPDPGAADADITAGYVLWSPPQSVTITKILHIPQAAWVAAAAANDGVVVVTNAAVGALATLSVVTALAVGSKNDMGAITNAAVVGGTNVTLTVTANGTANAPASAIQIEYVTAD